MPIHGLGSEAMAVPTRTTGPRTIERYANRWSWVLNRSRTSFHGPLEDHAPGMDERLRTLPGRTGALTFFRRSPILHGLDESSSGRCYRCIATCKTSALRLTSSVTSHGLLSPAQAGPAAELASTRFCDGITSIVSLPLCASDRAYTLTYVHKSHCEHVL